MPTLLVKTIGHFFPLFNSWLDDLGDSRDQTRVIYPRRFLAWWGLLLFILQLGSRRQLDFHLPMDSNALDNVNRLAHTTMTSRPVHDTLDHFLGQTQLDDWKDLRSQMIHHLLRQRVLDAARLEGGVPLLVDGSGQLVFHGERHCKHCLEQRHGHSSTFTHQVLEAKLLGPCQTVFSIATVFIGHDESSDASTQEQAKNDGSSDANKANQSKQDCELKAFDRLQAEVKEEYPRTRFCVLGDNLYMCGRMLSICENNDWSFVLVFKEGRTPSLWQEFQALLASSPENVLVEELADGVVREYRWVNDLSYTDSEGREWTLHAVQCQETVDGKTTCFAYVTDIRLTAERVVAVVRHGRWRWCIENEGFNRQKNSGLNMEHAYSEDPAKLEIYYVLMQIACILLVLFEKGSLLRELAWSVGKRNVVHLFGALKTLVERLREGLRCGFVDVAELARRRRISLCDSS